MTSILLAVLCFFQARAGFVLATSVSTLGSVPGQYIVLLRDDVVKANQLQNRVANWIYGTTASVLHTYESVMRGFTLTGVSSGQLRKINLDRAVLRVEPDQILEGDTTQLAVQNWGLDRIDQVRRPLNGKYNYQYTGEGVEVFIFDSGIRSDHKEFGRRVKCFANFVANETCEDQGGHGTHVAGIIGGAQYGVAKKTKLYSVKVLDSQARGLLSSALKGLDLVRQHKHTNISTPMVINLSLGGSASEIFDAAVNATVEAGIVVAVSAGNDRYSACLRSPASAAGAITVAASDNGDQRWKFSNYGPCVDLFAPGVQIVSSDYTAVNASVMLTGTSQASAFVSGAAALYLEVFRGASPTQIWEYMKADVAKGYVTDNLESPNRLLNLQLFNRDAPASAPVPTDSSAPSRSAVPSRSPSRSPEPTKSQAPSLCTRVGDRCQKDGECCSGICSQRGWCWFASLARKKNVTAAP